MQFKFLDNTTYIVLPNLTKFNNDNTVQRIKFLEYALIMH